jgi:MFS family permease
LTVGAGGGVRAPLLTRAFVLVTLANLTLNIAATLSIHLPGFLHALGARELEIGSIMSAHALAAFLAGPSAGQALDRHGRKLLIRAGCALYVLAAALYLAIDRIGPFVIAVRVIEGVSATMLYIALFTYAADLVPPARRTQGLAVFGASGLVPMGVSGVLGDAILAGSTYRAMFATALGFGVLGLLLCWRLPESLALSARTTLASERPGRAALLERDLLPVWVASFAFFFSMAGVLTFLKTYVLAIGHGSVGGFFGAYAGAALVLRLVFGWIPDRVGLRRMVLPSMASYGLGAGLLAGAGSDARVLLAGLLCGIGHSYAYPVYYSLVVTRARAGERGSAMAIYASIDWGAILIAGPALGLVIEHAGYGAAFGALAGVLTLGTAGFYALDRTEGATS